MSSPPSSTKHFEEGGSAVLIVLTRPVNGLGLSYQALTGREETTCLPAPPSAQPGLQPRHRDLYISLCLLCASVDHLAPFYLLTFGPTK